MAYVKVRFSCKTNGATAGLVLPYDKVSHATISELSRFFPYSEAPKMKRLELSPQYATQEEAFAHTFEQE